MQPQADIPETLSKYFSSKELSSMISFLFPTGSFTPDLQAEVKANKLNQGHRQAYLNWKPGLPLPSLPVHFPATQHTTAPPESSIPFNTPRRQPSQQSILSSGQPEVAARGRKGSSFSPPPQLSPPGFILSCSPHSLQKPCAKIRLKR